MQTIEKDIEQLNNFQHFQDIYKYSSFLYKQPASLLDYLPDDGFIIFDEMSRIQELANRLDKDDAKWYSSLIERHQMLKKSIVTFEWESLWKNMYHKRL